MIVIVLFSIDLGTPKDRYKFDCIFFFLNLERTAVLC